MSEENEMREEVEGQRQPDEHELLYQGIRKGMSANAMLYEHLSCGVRDLLPNAHAQDVEDALNMSCVSLGKAPLETLILIHTFLDNLQDIAMRRKTNV